MTTQTTQEYGCKFCDKTFDTPLKAAVHEQDNCGDNPEVNN